MPTGLDFNPLSNKKSLNIFEEGSEWRDEQGVRKLIPSAPPSCSRAISLSSLLTIFCDVNSTSPAGAGRKIHPSSWEGLCTP